MTVIKFNELLDYVEYPQAGNSLHSASQVIDLEFHKEGVDYDVKCHLELEYSRWFYPETHWGPQESECEIKHFILEPIKGFKYMREVETILSSKDLRKLLTYMENEIIFE